MSFRNALHRPAKQAPIPPPQPRPINPNDDDMESVLRRRMRLHPKAKMPVSSPPSVDDQETRNKILGEMAEQDTTPTRKSSPIVSIDGRDVEEKDPHKWSA